MPLDPRLQPLLNQVASQAQRGPREPMILLSEERAKLKVGVESQQMQAAIALSNEQEPIAHIENRVIPGPMGDIPFRLYTPKGTGPFPILMFFHGGGWFSGNVDTHELMCRSLCHGAQCLVLSVDYRLAPEHKFPAGLEDCYTATCWAATHAAEFQADPTRIAVSGDSGGGTFATVVALTSHDRSGPTLVFQLLLWPSIDFRITTPSWKKYDGYLMTSQEFLVVRDIYLNHTEEQSHPYAAPLFAPDLHGLPPALIITAECDPLRDGAEQYGQRLQEAGVPTTISRYDGMVHGFLHMKALIPTQANQAFTETSNALRATFTLAENEVS